MRGGEDKDSDNGSTAELAKILTNNSMATTAMGLKQIIKLLFYTA